MSGEVDAWLSVVNYSQPSFLGIDIIKMTCKHIQYLHISIRVSTLRLVCNVEIDIVLSID